MKVFWKRPSDQQLEQLLKDCCDEDYSHSNVGSTRDWRGDLFDTQSDSVVEDGYLIQRRRAKVGTGQFAFESATDALRQGVCFDLPWVHYHAESVLAEGVVFCLIANVLGMHPASACRVVYVDSEQNSTENSFALGIGTLPVHPAIGEEKLAIHWNKETNDVDFLIGSYSKPSSWISRLFVSYLRRQQDRFARDSVNRMKAACDVQRAKSSSQHSYENH